MGKVLKVILILSLSIFFIQPSVANEIDQAKLKKMFESCADNSFKNQFGNKYNNYLIKPLKVKISNSTPYEWFFEDCEIEHKNNPIKFKVKNSIYQEDINEITRKVFEICADQRYLSELNGDDFKRLLVDAGNEIGINGKDLFHPVRIALYGDSKGPDIPLIFSILGREETLRRLDKYI